MNKIKIFALAAALLVAGAAYADYNSCRCGLTAPGIDLNICCVNNYGGYGEDGDSRCCSAADTAAGKKWDKASKSCKTVSTCSAHYYMVLTQGPVASDFLYNDTCDGNIDAQYTCATGSSRQCYDISSITTIPDSPTTFKVVDNAVSVPSSTAPGWFGMYCDPVGGGNDTCQWTGLPVCLLNPFNQGWNEEQTCRGVCNGSIYGSKACDIVCKFPATTGNVTSSTIWGGVYCEADRTPKKLYTLKIAFCCPTAQ